MFHSLFRIGAHAFSLLEKENIHPSGLILEAPFNKMSEAIREYSTTTVILIYAYLFITVWPGLIYLPNIYRHLFVHYKLFGIKLLHLFINEKYCIFIRYFAISLGLIFSLLTQSLKMELFLIQNKT